MMKDIIIIGFIFCASAFISLAYLTVEEFKKIKIVHDARAKRLYQLEIEMWEVKRLLKKGKKNAKV
jgi:hypothetical protein